MTNTIRLKITCFLLLFTVLLIKDILDLAWHLATRMKFGTCEQNWDLYGTISGLWSQLGPSPKFGTSLRALFLLFGFFLFRDQIFRNRNRDFFPRPNFFETETETFYPKPNFLKPKLKPSKNWQKFRNREVSKPKCQSLAAISQTMFLMSLLNVFSLLIISQSTSACSKAPARAFRL